MKKLILSFIVLGLSVNAMHADITAIPVVSESHSSSTLGIAMDVDEDGVATFSPVTAHKSGTDVNVVIFGPKCSIVRKFTIGNMPDNASIESAWIESADLASVYITRNFYVKNDKWCVVLNQNQTLMVIDEDGNNLGNLPTDLIGTNLDIFLDGFYQGTPYMLGVSSGPAHDWSDYECRLYSFTTNGAGIGVSEVKSVMNAYPNPLPVGHTFNVDLPQSADDATFLCVTDMNGRQVCRRKVPCGETGYKFSGLRFGHGHYIYTIIYGDGKSVSGKLIAE